MTKILFSRNLPKMSCSHAWMRLQQKTTKPNHLYSHYDQIGQTSRLAPVKMYIGIRRIK